MENRMIKRLALLLALLAPMAAHADPVTAAVAWAAATFAVTTATVYLVAATVILSTGMAVYGSAQARRAERDAQNARNAAMQDRMTTRIASESPHRYIYGTARVGSDIVAMFTSGDKDQYKHIVCVLAAHECDAVEEVYINNVAIGLSSVTAEGDITGGRYVRNPDTNVIDEPHIGPSFMLSKMPITGSVSAYVGYGAEMQEVAVTSASGRNVTVDHTGNVLVSYEMPMMRRFGEAVDDTAAVSQIPYVRVQVHLGGATDPADAYLMSVVPGKWAPTAVLRGLTYLVVTLDLNNPEFQNGQVPIQALVRGRKLYDPRTGLTAWSSNPALCIYDYLTSPLCGVPAADLPVAQYIAAANACDEVIGWFSSARYTLNGTVTSDQSQSSVLEAMAECMGGGIVSTSWDVHAGKYIAPVAALTQEDIVGSIAITPGVSDAAIYNGVKGQFLSAENGYVLTDFKPYQNDVYRANDGRDLYTNIDFPFTNNSQRVTNLARIFTEDQRNGFTLKAEFSLKAWSLKVGQRITFTSAYLGQTAKIYRITDKSYAPNSAIELTLKEDDPSIWDLADAVTLDSTPNTDLPDPWAIAPLASLTCTSGVATLLTQPDGSIMPRILVSWPAATTQAVFTSGEIEIEWRAVSTDTWHKTVASGSATEAYLASITPGWVYVVRGRTVNPYLNTKSNWVSTTYQVEVVSAMLTVYKWAAAIPAAPVGTAALAWSTGLFGAAPAGWSLTKPAAPVGVDSALWAAGVLVSDIGVTGSKGFDWSTASVEAIGSTAGAAAIAAQASADAAQAAAVQAEANAIATAAAAAQAKADLAVVTANAYADGIVTTEESRAIADATTKANVAQAAATAAAALDATAKADLAAFAPSAVIGGGNLYPDSGFERALHPCGSQSSVGTLDFTHDYGVAPYRGTRKLFFDTTNSQPAGTVLDCYVYLGGPLCPVKAGVQYTISFMYATGTNYSFTGTSSYLRLYDASNNAVAHVAIPMTTADFVAGLGVWKLFEFQWTCPADITNIEMRFGFGAQNYSWMTVDCIQVEVGNKRTQWSPAPEDVTAGIADAQAAAALDATAKANAAHDTAVSTAAAAAQAKADLAQVTASAYADGIVSTEEARAIADATAKANAAQSAAIAAAALDATAKANAAHDTAVSTAAAAAQAKADLAQVTASAYADGIVTDAEARNIADATAKANAAQAAATAAAAADATAKADAAVATVDLGDGTHFGARNRNDPPAEYLTGTTKQFKTRAALLSSDSQPPGGSDTYCTLETIKQYADITGGGVYQYAYIGSSTWRRFGPNPASPDTTGATWFPWVLDLDRTSYTGDLNATLGANASNFNATVGGDNLSYNSGFEDNDGTTGTGWSVYNNSPAETVTPSLGGGRVGGVAQIISWITNNSSTKGIYGSNICKEGWQPYHTYTLSFYAKTTALANATTMMIAWNTQPSLVSSVNPGITTAWQRYSFTFVWGAAVEASGAGFLSISPVAGGGNVWFDDVMVVEGDVLPAYYPSTAQAAALAATAQNTATTANNTATAVQTVIDTPPVIGGMTDVIASVYKPAVVIGTKYPSVTGGVAPFRFDWSMVNTQAGDGDPSYVISTVTYPNDKLVIKGLCLVTGGTETIDLVTCTSTDSKGRVSTTQFSVSVSG